MAATSRPDASHCFFHKGDTKEPMTEQQACQVMFENWGCGENYWTMKEQNEDEKFGLARQHWWIFLRHAPAKPSKLIRFWHGTSLDAATRILSKGFVVSSSKDNRLQGMSGICSFTHNGHGMVQQLCRRYALDRAKTHLSEHWKDGGPIDSWAAPVSICFLVPADYLVGLKEYRCIRSGTVLKSVFVGEEGDVQHWTINQYAEVHIPHRNYWHTQIHREVAHEVKSGQRIKCVWCNNTKPEEESFHWQRGETLECGPCNYWAHHMER